MQTETNSDNSFTRLKVTWLDSGAKEQTSILCGATEFTPDFLHSRGVAKMDVLNIEHIVPTLDADSKELRYPALNYTSFGNVRK